jgi:CPA2 family monovalent cation:H+ antiporter-2
MGYFSRVLLLLAVIASTSEARTYDAKPSVVVPVHARTTARSSSASVLHRIPRGGGGNMVTHALQELKTDVTGPKSDTLLLMLTTALIPAICGKLSVSPILGFLANGLLLGPNGGKLITDVHTTEAVADLGVVLFLFEMGIHLDFKTLMDMRMDVFGLGLSQFLITAVAVAMVARTCGMDFASQVVLGGGLALSSSAFVLQLLKDKNQLETEFGRSSFGVLLLQDLAVVPLLVVTPLLKGGEGLGGALAKAGVQAILALGVIALAGKFVLTPLFDLCAKSGSQEAFLGAILSTVLGFSFLTEGLGLSNTLGAFLAGVILSETPHRHHIEKEISPFRGILVGLFFFTVGFEIDLSLIFSKIGLVSSIVLGIMSGKAVIATLLCRAFGRKLSVAQQVGLMLSQGGEFAFVAFRLARSLNILDADTTKLMLTCVSLTMALTPFAEEIGSKMALRLEEKDKTKAPSKKKVRTA